MVAITIIAMEISILKVNGSIAAAPQLDKFAADAKRCVMERQTIPF
jgi:hypothetical protein